MSPHAEPGGVLCALPLEHSGRCIPVTHERIPSGKAAPAHRPEPYGFPWCLHKDPGSEEWDVTRLCDQARVMLQECGGIRTEDQ